MSGLLSTHKNNGIYYFQFRDKVSGELLNARSTGKTDRIEAQVQAELWKANGIPTSRIKELLIE